jgi:disulfide oxidoreductase YuzD
MKHLKRFNENFITDLFKKSDEDKIADEILKKLETSEVKWVTNFSGLERKKGPFSAHYLSEIVFENNTIQVRAYKVFSEDSYVCEIYIDDDLLECSNSKSKKIYQFMEKKSSVSSKEQSINRIKSKIKFDGVPKMKNPHPPKIKRRNIFPG